VGWRWERTALLFYIFSKQELLTHTSNIVHNIYGFRSNLEATPYFDKIETHRISDFSIKSSGL
jgi:hypothetical protein